MANVPINPVFFDASGSFSQQRWIDYWSALWSAPSQPGYATVVREGVAALRSLAQELLDTANAVGANEAGAAGSDNPVELLQGAIGQLPTYAALASATSDGPALVANVVQPLLTQGQQPLLKIGRAAQTLVKYTPPRPWAEIFSEEIAKPLSNFSLNVGGAVLRKLLPIAIVVGLGYYLLTRKEGAGE
jgi:hypothetical protein